MKSFWVRFEKRGLISKLLIGFGALLILILLLGITSILTIREMSKQVDQLYRMELLGVSHIKEVNINLILIGRTLRQLVLATDNTERIEVKSRLDQAVLDVDKELGAVRKSLFRESGKQYLHEFEIAFDHYKRNVNYAIALTEENVEYQSKAIAFISSDQFNQAGDAAEQTLRKIAEIKLAGAQETAGAMMKNSRDNQWFRWGLIFSGLCFGVAVGVLTGRSIKRPCDDLRFAIDKLANGNVSEKIPLTDYPNEIGVIARGVEQLQTIYREMESQRWGKTHLAEIATRLQQADSFVRLSTDVLSTLCPLIGAGYGVFYVKKGNESLDLLSGYGYREHEQLKQKFSLGEGLVGQCAIEKKPSR